MDNKEDIGLYRYGTPIIEQVYNNVIRLLQSKLKHVELKELTGISSQMVGHIRKTLIEKGDISNITFAKVLQFNSAFDTPEKIEYIKKRDEELYHYILPQLIEIPDEDKKILKVYEERAIAIQKQDKKNGGENYIAINCPHCSNELTFSIEMKLKP